MKSVKALVLAVVSFAAFAAAPGVLAQTVPSGSAGATITNIYPQSGPPGTTVTINGTGFPTVGVIHFGPGLIPINRVATNNSTQLQFTIPSILTAQCAFQNPPCAQSTYSISEGTYNVSVGTSTRSQAISNETTFTVTPSAVITSVSQNFGAIGDTITINGTGFSTYANSINLDTPSVQGVVLQIYGNSSTSIQFIIPSTLYPRCAFVYPPCLPTGSTLSPGTYSLSVSPGFQFDKTTNAVSFTIGTAAATPPGPVITGMTPTAGTVGTTVTVQGSGFSPNFDVIGFGPGIIIAKPLSATTLTFDVPNWGVAPNCTFFSNPPCKATATLPLSPGTFNVTVAVSPTEVSSPVPFTLNAIPIPTSLPPVSTSTPTILKATTALNVRSQPSTAAPIIGTEASGSVGLFVGGPVTADGYDWLQIKWRNRVTGWSAKNYTAPALASCPINIGDSAWVTGGGTATTLYIRSSPSNSASVTGAEAIGAQGTIIAGPTIADLSYWWQLKFPDGASGWATESNFADMACSFINATGTYTPPPTLAAPSVTITSPATTNNLSGKVTITAAVSSTSPIANVQFYVGSTLIGTVTSAPYTVTWDASQEFDGSYALSAKANTTTGLSGQTSVTVNTIGGLTSPRVTINTPLSNAVVSGLVTITATVPANSPPVTEVDFSIDGNIIGKDTTAPYTVTWDSSKAVNGGRYLSVTAITSMAGITGSDGEWLSVTGGIDPNQPNAPTFDVKITSPVTGSTVSGQVPITATASSSAAVAAMDFYVDGVALSEDTTAPFTATWDSTNELNGGHYVSAVARDASGNTGSGTSWVTVTGGLSYPKVSFTSPLPGTTISGTINVCVSVTGTNPPPTEVDFFANGQSIGTATPNSSGVACTPWNSSLVYSGENNLLAVAKTARADITGSNSINLSVTGGKTPPAIDTVITMPQNATTVFGNVPINAIVSSSIAITGVTFTANGQPIATVSTPAAGGAYSTVWSAATAVPGSYAITATPNFSGGSGQGASVTVNLIAPPKFSPGQQVGVQTQSSIGLNVRATPSTGGSIIGTEPNLVTGIILNSIPVIANNYNWWYVKYTDGVTGWSVESYLVAQ